MQSLDTVLQSVFGLQQFRPRQKEIIADVLAGHDVVCVMPTGAGKSLCFQLPAVMVKGVTLVISPLISLMADQVAHLRRMKIPALLLNSSLTFDQQRQITSELHRGFQGLLYVAPERFSAPSFQSLLPKLNTKLFVVDEAHCVSFWGHDFRPDYLTLADVRKKLGSPVTMSLTATATPQVRRDIVDMLALRDPKMHVTGFDRPNLAYSSRRIESEIEKDAVIVQHLKQHKGSGIVYCSTRKFVEALTELLEEQFPDRTVSAYHAGMENAVRKNSQARFMSKADSIVVATNAFGMGINKPDIRFVIHYNLPGSVEAYYQEAGRAGRDGAPADCLLLFGTRDIRTQEFFINKIGENNPSLKDHDVARLQVHSRRKLGFLENYAANYRCRRRQILDYFGEATPITNCRCDVCLRTTTPRWQPPAPKFSQSSPPLKKKRMTKTPLSDLPLDSAAEVRFERLKKVRRQLADEQQWPAYCVMHDSTLKEVARRSPGSIQELALIKGIGDKKAVHFGPALLKALKD
ncbi:MAG: RecQ family ATP-dependent DNA helicase [Terriglobales bacterium]